MPENNDYMYENAEVVEVSDMEYPPVRHKNKAVDAGCAAAIAGLVVLAWEGIKFGVKWGKAKIEEAKAVKAAMDAQNQNHEAPRSYTHVAEPEVVKAGKKK